MTIGYRAKRPNGHIIPKYRARPGRVVDGLKQTPGRPGPFSPAISTALVLGSEFSPLESEKGYSAMVGGHC
ncbi:hypothetical protein PanWU01x14_006840 [Parasponia andersonii]|uniref:Uncharacterized protein n=1 Tax=Parasponia andersonii TaxID=3476 RepID=A0A2P5E3W7_PARAD|nr:hypothetical protein PanWU01x14_006840 [Parasponia andersonii]